LRAAIIGQLVAICSKPSFWIPEVQLIRYMMVNIPKALPINTLLAVAATKSAYWFYLISIPYLNISYLFFRSWRFPTSQQFIYADQAGIAPAVSRDPQYGPVLQAQGGHGGI
jgi:hypothetical protein